MHYKILMSFKQSLNYNIIFIEDINNLINTSYLQFTRLKMAIFLLYKLAAIIYPLGVNPKNINKYLYSIFKL